MANEGTSLSRGSSVDQPNIASFRGKHRATQPEKSKVLLVESHLSMMNEWPISCDRFTAALQLASCHCIPHLSYEKLDHNLITALIERWNPMTNTFNLPVGEMTITLEDIGMILGLQVDGPPFVGQPVVGTGRRWATWPDCCNDLLGTHPEADFVYHDPWDHEDTAKFTMGQARAQTCVPLRWLRWTFRRQSYEDLDEISFLRHVRAYILYAIGSFLLADTSGNEIHLQYLPLLENLEVFGKLSFGGAVLAHLYRELYVATNPKRAKLSSCVHLLQIWAWEHLPVGRPVIKVPTPEEMFGYSVGYRWNCIKLTREMPSGNLATYRDELDGLLDSQVTWEPYTRRIRANVAQICRAGSAIWMARVPVINWKRVEWYLPDRVLRQFGCLPSIHVKPIEETFERVDGRGKPDTDWTAYHVKYITLWNQRSSSLVPVKVGNTPREIERAVRNYMRWYKSWASIYLLRPPSNPPRSYYPRAATERQLRETLLSAEQLFEPFYGSDDNSAQQVAINKFEQLMISTKQEMYIPDTTYRESDDDMSAAPSTQKTQTSYQPVGGFPPTHGQHPHVPQHYQYMPTGTATYPYPMHQPFSGGVVMSQFQQWPDSEMNWAAPTINTPTHQQSFFPPPLWSTEASVMGTSHFQNEAAQTMPTQQSSQPHDVAQAQRQRRKPDKYTPEQILRMKGKAKK